MAFWNNDRKGNRTFMLTIYDKMSISPHKSLSEHALAEVLTKIYFKYFKNKMSKNDFLDKFKKTC